MWIDKMSYNPINTLLNSSNPYIEYFTRLDLLEEEVPDVNFLWELPESARVIRRQKSEGYWEYPGGNKRIRSAENYNQLETFRQVGDLVEKYGFNKDHPSIEKAVEYLFSCQSNEGDFRGIYGNQYATTYSAAIMELLIKAGYQNDERIEKGFQWLLNQRQKDGGWVIPFRTLKITYSDSLKLPEAIQSNPDKPFSHLVTGMVLRAFAAHPDYRHTPEAQHAGRLMMSRFFQRDKYSDRQDKKYWESVSFPFWFTNIVTSLDSLYYLGFKKEELTIENALDWLVQHQKEDGTFDLKLLMIHDKDLKYWVTLAISRIFKNYYG